MSGAGDEARLRRGGAGKKKVTAPAGNGEWTGWRGPGRDGRVAWLPERLPARPHVVWRSRLPSRGLGGIAATREMVIVSARELMDSTDAYLCLRADSGKEVWKVLCPAPAERELDYGNSPRATPLIHGKHVFLSGALGNLLCVELATGRTVWEKDLRDEFGVKDDRKWGFCSSPLIAGGRLIVNPGGKAASLVALDPASGKVLWTSPGAAASYGNLIAATLGGRRQIVGFDADSLGGWDAASGKRLWRVTPPRRSDFNVPTPVVVGDRLVVPWENNGTLLYRFRDDGVMDPKPLAHQPRLAPDTHSPVVSAGRLFGAWNGLHCLDLKRLEPVWLRRDSAFLKYLTLVASDERVLAVTLTGELILFDAAGPAYRERGRLQVFADENGLFAHPAFVGSRVYLRSDEEIVCLDLAP